VVHFRAGSERARATTFIQRLNTSGTVAPSMGCASSTDLGRQAFVPRTADHLLYTDRKDDAEDRDCDQDLCTQGQPLTREDKL
jgi:hypothetical protein